MMTASKKPMLATREISSIPIRDAAKTWRDTKTLNLETLHALGYKDLDGFKRALDALDPVMNFFYMTHELEQGDIVLDTGNLKLRVQFPYERTNSELDDLTVPIVDYLDEMQREPIPTLTVSTENPPPHVFQKVVERANESGILNIRLRSIMDDASPEEAQATPIPEDSPSIDTANCDAKPPEQNTESGDPAENRDDPFDPASFIDGWNTKDPLKEGAQ